MFYNTFKLRQEKGRRYYGDCAPNPQHFSLGNPQSARFFHQIPRSELLKYPAWHKPESIIVQL